MIRRAAIAVLAVLVLTSCAPRGEVADDPGATAPTPTAEASAPALEPPTAKPALSELVIGPEGLGPLLIGSAPPSFGADLDVLVYVDDYCATAFADGSASEPGLWVANYPEALANEADRPFGVWVADEGIMRITVFKPGVLTERGIGVGSTRDEVLAAYPEGFSSNYEPAWTNVVYVVDGTTGHLLIEIADADTPTANTVLSLTSAPLSDPITVTAGTDSSLGRCVNG